jgi:preprotein translocase subunit SecF
VLLRSLNTSIAALLPVLSLLLIGAGLLGQVTLQEFALALLVGMLTGAYSSLFIAAPLVGWLKSRSHQFARRHSDNAAHLVGEELRTVVIRGTASARAPAPRRRSTASAPATAAAPPTAAAASTTQVLSHPPRPRKKKRR